MDVLDIAQGNTTMDSYFSLKKKNHWSNKGGVKGKGWDGGSAQEEPGHGLGQFKKSACILLQVLPL